MYGNLGYKLLAEKSNMPSKTPLRDWIRAYNTQGVEGLKRRKVKVAYSVQFKLDTLHFMLETGASYQETAEQFRLNNSSLIHRWMKTFDEQGEEGLHPKHKGRPSMSQNQSKRKTKRKS
ncbi:helix-turn-helix domain-containing protein [Virgibacillus halophilus]